MKLNPDIQKKIDSYLDRHGMRRTRQRDIIIEAAFQSDEHFTAEELWDRAREIDPKASRATLYRNLNMLLECGALQEIDLGKDQTYYDPNFSDKPGHNHLICVDCGKVVEFEDSHMEVLEDCLTRRLGFRPTRKSLRIEACCDQLRKEGFCENLIDQRLAKQKS